MKCSVIICTLKRPLSVKRLLESICQQKRLPYQLIIVDASDDHETEEVVKKADEVVEDKLEYYRTERGLTRQRNFGLARATGDIIGFFDDDVVPDDDYMAEITKVFESDDEGKVGGATGYIYRKKASGSRIRYLFNKVRGAVCGPRKLLKYYNISPMPEETFTDVIPIRYVSGCNMFFRKEVFLRHKFDEWFEGYGQGEDREFGLRVSKNWRILAVGPARLHHLREPSSRPNYRELGRMCTECGVRVLTVARDDHVLSNALKLIFWQMVDILTNSATFFLVGRFRDGIGYTVGGLSGIKPGLKHVIRSIKSQRQNKK